MSQSGLCIFSRKENHNDVKTGDEMDLVRKNSLAYKYLCHLEEIKTWIENCLKEKLPPTTELEENLRNGIYLAKIGNFIAPNILPKNKIYDIDQQRFKKDGLQFRHTDNINMWLKILKFIELPETFHPETTDIYDKKNMPRVIYCLHALSAHLFKLGRAPDVIDLFGKIDFSNEIIEDMNKKLQNYNSMPSFNKIDCLLSKNKNNNYIKNNHNSFIGFLSEEIIQNNSTNSNTLLEIAKVFSNSDENGLFELLSLPCLNLKNLQNENKMLYHKKIINLEEKFINSTNVPDIFEFLNRIIIEANVEASESSIRKNVILVNNHLNTNDFENLYISLNSLGAHFNVVIDKFSMPLIYEELIIEKIDHGKKLECNEIIDNLHLLLNISNVSKILDLDDKDLLWNSLNKVLDKSILNKKVIEDYCVSLKLAYKAKQNANLSCVLLTLLDIKECIETINTQDIEAHKLISCIQLINSAINTHDQNLLMKTLKHEFFFQNIPIKDSESDFYLEVFSIYKKRNNSELWLDDIQKIITECENDMIEVENKQKMLINFNLALLEKNKHEIIEFVKKIYNLYLKEIDECKLFDEFIQLLREKNNNICPWVVYHTKSGKIAYINIENYNHMWKIPNDFSPNSHYFSVKDITNILNKFTNQYENKILYLIVNLQSHCKGFLIRKNLDRQLFIIKHKKEVIIIQAWWRSVSIQRKYRKILNEKIAKNKKNILTPEDKWLYYKKMEKNIIIIQALWRGKCARRAFLSLFQMKYPPFKAVKYFTPLLDFNIQDYENEIQLQTLKADIVQTIRKNQKISKQLDDMDVKIGLLIQNRITLQDVIAHRTKTNNTFSSSDKLKISDKNISQSYFTTPKGLKTLTKENKNLIDGYQKLFYLLQTNPQYLSKLLFCLPQIKTYQFLQNVILTLYNYGSSSRDEYLLLKLFRFGLEEEINCLFNKPQDIISGNSIILKIVVNHARQVNGLTALRNIIGPLIEKILKAKSSIETSPIDIYKNWRNQMETQSGKVSSLPYSVTQEQALSYDEVRIRLNHNIETLKSKVSMFLENITNSFENLPFSITYIARVLYYTLNKKFSSTPEKELLKIIGHLVYYQFMNPVIITPEAFDIIKMPPDKIISNEQRRNLASIAKILHFASSKKGFGDESAHLQILNSFIIDCHGKMKDFFHKCCYGPTLEEYFMIDEYSEATLLYKPQIYISVQEICDTHSLLVEYENYIAPDPLDKLHEILDSINPKGSENTIPIALLASPSSEICLTLEYDDQNLPEDLTDINKFFIKTKELCITVLPFLNGNNLLEALNSIITKKQQDNYKSYIDQRLYSGIIKSHEKMTLLEHVKQLKKCINKLEDEGYVLRENGYQSIITAIALDLCNKGKYRRNQLRALQILKNTKQILDEKFKNYKEQSNYYNDYINKCLENLNGGKRSIYPGLHQKGKGNSKFKSKACLKYSASKLYDKGILIEIDGLAVPQLKNVLFEIIPTEHNGVFSVRGKFMGVKIDTVEIDIQYLLQLQYEGSSIIDLFGKAKINVNLLLFLLNSKYYGKMK